MDVIREEKHEITEHRPEHEEPEVTIATAPAVETAETTAAVEEAIAEGFDRSIERENAAWQAMMQERLAQTHTMVSAMHSQMMEPQVSTSPIPHSSETPQTVELSMPHESEEVAQEAEEAAEEPVSTLDRAKRKIFHRMR